MRCQTSCSMFCLVFKEKGVVFHYLYGKLQHLLNFSLITSVYFNINYLSGYLGRVQSTKYCTKIQKSSDNNNNNKDQLLGWLRGTKMLHLNISAFQRHIFIPFLRKKEILRILNHSGFRCSRRANLVRLGAFNCYIPQNKIAYHFAQILSNQSSFIFLTKLKH